MYILFNFWSFILYLICTSVHSILMAKLALFKTWFSQVSFTIQPANKHVYCKKSDHSCTTQHVDKMDSISCKSDSCLQTTTGFLFQMWGHWKPFLHHSHLAQSCAAHTTDHSFVPWHAGQKYQHISKYLLLCVLWVTGTPATWWPGSFSRIKTITVMDWFQPGSPLDRPNTADTFKHRESFHFWVLQAVLFLDLWLFSIQLMLHFITAWHLKMNAK